MTQVTISEAAQFLRSRDRFLILTHRNPDGDTLGSAGGLCLALRGMGKTANVLMNPQITRLYEPELRGLTTEFEHGCTLVAVDAASAGMLQKNQELEGTKIDLVLDHHGTHDAYGERYLVMPQKASCGEVILELLRELSCAVTPEIARLLYIAVSTDTGCFRYRNTRADTLAAASELVTAGAPNGELNRRLFTVKRLQRLRLESEIIANLELLREGRLAIASITSEMLSRLGTDEADLEDITNVAMQPEGVEMAVTLREEPDGGTKISIRTVEFPNASKVCAELGGGGHGRAAGVTLPSGLADARTQILATIDKWWGKE